jgi:hypothetical protein
MKKIGLLLLVCSFILSSFAQPGTLLVSSSNNQRFWIFVDDVLQNEYSVPSIKLTGMRFQNYKIRIEIDNASAHCVGQIISITNQRYGDSYMVSYRSSGYSISKTQSNIRPVLTQLLIQPNYNYYNDYYHYLYPGFGNPGNYWQGSGNNHGKPYHYNQYPNQGGGYSGGNKPPVVHPTTPPPPPPGGGGHGNIGNCRNSHEFALAINSLRNESFETGKINFAKSMTTSGPICVDQIIQVCNIFSFEASKLEYAKFAYQYCTDKNLYYLVNNVFQFQASKDELSKFIR